MNGKTVILKTIENKVFPAYAAQIVDPNTIVVGGGGPGNTGTFNGLVFLRLEHDGNSGYSVVDGTFSTTEQVDTMAIHEQENEKFIAIGLSKQCVICKISIRRKQVDSLANGIEDIPSIEYFAVTLSSELVCASSCVTRVKISPDGTFLAVGCENGSIKIYSFPSMVLIREILAHKQLISDLDITEDGQKICSVARNGLGVMWQVKDGKRLNDLELPNWAKYTFKRVKFSSAGRKNKIWLYTIANPVVNSTNPSTLYKYNTANFSIEEKAFFKDTLSALATSPDSSYIAVGNMNGDVMVHDAKTLRRIYLFKADRFGAITDLQFLRPPIPFRTTDGSMNLALISTSLNGFTKLHSLAEDSRPNKWLFILLILFGVLLVYFLKFFEVDVTILELIENLMGPDPVKTEL